MNFSPGALVTARGRDWVVLAHDAPELVMVRPSPVDLMCAPEFEADASSVTVVLRHCLHTGRQRKASVRDKSS